MFGLKKQSKLLQSYLPFSESCAVVFGELGLSTLPCLYILEVNKVVYAEQSRTTALERKSSECGVKLINKIPNPNDLKSCIFILKVSNSTETPLFFWLMQFTMSVLKTSWSVTGSNRKGIWYLCLLDHWTN